MKRYDKYKPSGVEWIGEIPEHWEVKRLKYVADIRPSNVDKKTVEGEIPILLCNYNDVYKNDFIVDSLNFMEATATEKEIEKFILRLDDVLITKDSETPDDIAKSAFVTQDFNNVICGYHLAQITTIKSILLGEFLFRLFQSKEFNAHFEVSANGVTRFGLPLSSITCVKTVLPPKPEQTAIANFLDEKTSQIDKLITNKQKLIELLKEERTAIINHAVTRGINPDVKLKPSGIEWLGDIPEHWEVKKLKHVANILSGYSPEQCKPSENIGIPYIKVDNLNLDTPCIDIAKEYTVKEFIVSQKPSILFPKRGAAIALNKVALVDFPFCMDTNLMGLEILDNSLIDILFVYFWLKSFSLITLADTSTIPQINNKHIEPLQIFLPLLKEQNRIVKYIETETRKIDNTISKIEKEIELLQEYRTALISEVVTGKIKVPND